MKRLLSTIRFDVLFQFRHGFYYVYAVVSVLYILVLKSVGGELKEVLAAMMVFSDTSVLGFFFVGSIVILERDQNTLESLFVTPLRPYEYIISKAVSLTILSAVMSSVIMFVSFGKAFNPYPVLAGVILSSMFFTLVGIIVSVYSPNVNQYLMMTVPSMIVFFLPLLDYFGLVRTPVFYIFPTQAALTLIDGGFNAINPVEAIYAFLMLLLWITAAWYLSGRMFFKYIIMKTGDAE
jgi:fluoroquinolone transport system permease protein